MKEAIDIYYNEEGDYLEVSFGEPPKKEYTEQLDSKVLITKDEDTNEVKSIGILAFKKRVYLLKKVLTFLNKKLPIEISIPSN